jgi:hypothetical protein
MNIIEVGCRLRCHVRCVGTSPARREARRVRPRRHRYPTRERVLPELMGASAGMALGLNIEWKLGRHTRRA